MDKITIIGIISAVLIVFAPTLYEKLKKLLPNIFKRDISQEGPLKSQNTAKIIAWEQLVTLCKGCKNPDLMKKLKELPPLFICMDCNEDK